MTLKDVLDKLDHINRDLQQTLFVIKGFVLAYALLLMTLVACYLL